MLRIGRLTVENLTKECVTDNPRPRFSYYLESDRENVSLKSAVIRMNGWSTVTEDQVAVPYGGPELEPFTRYAVTVHVTDDAGETAEARMDFETGRLHTPWTAKWITDGSYHFKEAKISPKTMTFRKKIDGIREVKSAKLYVTALGIYELQLNGGKVGNDYFAPGFTSYRHQLQYQTYDITDSLRDTNELIAVVGGGWAVGAFTYKRRNRVYAKRQALLCELRIVHTDGSTEVIGTDETWSVTEDGRYRETEFYNGEVYDAAVEYDQISWRNAALEEVRIHPEITAQYGVPVRAHELFRPVSVTRAKSGMLIYDFGQNFAGVICARLRGRKGQRIVWKHAEILMGGELYTEPLRTARQEAVYCCVDGEQTYSPRMTYMGFRYVGVEGIEEKDLELTAAALYSDIEETGDFRCSHNLVNQLQSSIKWGAKSNFVDIPTDCPQRDERMGWTGDIALFSPTAAYNFNMSRFLEKWLRDVKSEQSRGGGIPMTVPLVRVPLQWEIMIPLGRRLYPGSLGRVPGERRPGSPAPHVSRHEAVYRRVQILGRPVFLWQTPENLEAASPLWRLVRTGNRHVGMDGERQMDGDGMPCQLFPHCLRNCRIAGKRGGRRILCEAECGDLCRVPGDSDGEGWHGQTRISDRLRASTLLPDAIRTG